MIRKWLVILLVAAMALSGCVYNVGDAHRVDTHQGWEVVTHADAPLFTMSGWDYGLAMVKDTRIYGEWYGGGSTEIPAVVIYEDNTFEYVYPYSQTPTIIYGTWEWGHQSGILLSLPNEQYVALLFMGFNEDGTETLIQHYDFTGSFDAILRKSSNEYVAPENTNHT